MDNTNLQDLTNDIVNAISELADEVVDSSAGAPVQSMELPDEYLVPAPESSNLTQGLAEISNPKLSSKKDTKKKSIKKHSPIKMNAMKVTKNKKVIKKGKKKIGRKSRNSIKMSAMKSPRKVLKPAKKGKVAKGKNKAKRTYNTKK